MRKALMSVVALVCAVVLSSCSLLPIGPPGVPFPDSGQKSEARMKQIAAALNDHDAAALKAMFSARALEKAADLDTRLDGLLSLFSSGGLTWKPDASATEGDDGYGAELLNSYYKVSADGIDYSLFFADIPLDEPDPDNVGLYALGVAAWAEDRNSGPSEPFFYWAGSIHLDDNGETEDGEFGYPGIYVPRDDVVLPSEQGDARMEKIAAALNDHNAAAVKGMFSTRALEQASSFDKSLNSLLAFFPNGGITWEQQVVNSSGDDKRKKTKLLTAEYKVSAGGKDYWLFFADFAVDTVDPENVGIAALGITPWTEPGAADGDTAFDSLTGSWISYGTGDTGVYVPAG